MADKLHLFGDMIVFSSYAMQVIMSFLMLAMIFMMFPRAQVSAKRINEVLDTEILLKMETLIVIRLMKKELLNLKMFHLNIQMLMNIYLKNISFKA